MMLKLDMSTKIFVSDPMGFEFQASAFDIFHKVATTA